MTKKSEHIIIKGEMETKPNNEITLKEVYERLVALETKFDYQVAKGEGMGRRYGYLTAFIILVELVNFVFNYLIYVK